jgi:hypothetical protein
MALREVTIAALVLRDMAPHTAIRAIAPGVTIRAMAMAGDTDAGQGMPQLMAPAPPRDMATATPTMTATPVTELTAPGVTGTLRCVTNDRSTQPNRALFRPD